MPSAKKINEPGHITIGNVLEPWFSAQDLKMEIKYDLWVPIQAEIEARTLKQVQLAKVLRIDQPDASLLLRGQISKFSITRLLQFADRLGLTVKLTVIPPAPSSEGRKQARIPMRKTVKSRQNAAKAASPARRRAAA